MADQPGGAGGADLADRDLTNRRDMLEPTEVGGGSPSRLQRWREATERGVDDLRDDRGRTVCLSGERVALFKYDGKISAMSNACKHQNGPFCRKHSFALRRVQHSSISRHASILRVLRTGLGEIRCHSGGRTGKEQTVAWQSRISRASMHAPL